MHADARLARIQTPPERWLSFSTTESDHRSCHCVLWGCCLERPRESLHREDDFADVLPRVDVAVRLSGLREGKHFADKRLDLPGGVHAEDVLELAAQQGL